MAALIFPEQRVAKCAKAATIALFGLPISNVTMKEAVHNIDLAVRSRNIHQIATANLDFARNALRDRELQRVICECSMVLPDGAPMLWAAQLLGDPLQERVTGIDLIPELARLSVQNGYRIFFLGSSDESLAKAAQVLELRFPGIQIVGRYAPPIGPLHTMNNGTILRRIHSAKPDILLVAFGNPKQEFWIHRFKNSVNVPVQIGVGGSFEIISGKVRRAPAIVQKLQMEWLYRMSQEPTRLLPRYVRDAAALARHLPLGLVVHQMQPSKQVARHSEVRSGDSNRELILGAKLTGDHCDWLNREVQNALREGQSLLVNMRNVQRLNPDGIGCLMEARRQMHGQGLSLWLLELTPLILRVMEYSGVKDLFLIAESTREAGCPSTLAIL